MTLPTSAPAEPMSGSANVTLSEQDRWAAWHARGAEHDRVIKRRMTFAVPLLAIAFIVVVFLLSR